ncbi:unnamed protein product [Amoebophrya sp. A120]|nr:unnamed protein product [Amoebophrya sp. A120]|eukprot:GSA120T00005747001.1
MKASVRWSSASIASDRATPARPSRFALGVAVLLAQAGISLLFPFVSAQNNQYNNYGNNQHPPPPNQQYGGNQQYYNHSPPAQGNNYGYNNAPPNPAQQQYNQGAVYGGGQQPPQQQPPAPPPVLNNYGQPPPPNMNYGQQPPPPQQNYGQPQYQPPAQQQNYGYNGQPQAPPPPYGQQQPPPPPPPQQNYGQQQQPPPPQYGQPPQYNNQYQQPPPPQYNQYGQQPPPPQQYNQYNNQQVPPQQQYGQPPPPGGQVQYGNNAAQNQQQQHTGDHTHHDGQHHDHHDDHLHHDDHHDHHYDDHYDDHYFDYEDDWSYNDLSDHVDDYSARHNYKRSDKHLRSFHDSDLTGDQGVVEKETSLSPEKVTDHEELERDWAFGGATVLFPDRVLLTPDVPNRLGFMWTEHNVESRSFKIDFNCSLSLPIPHSLDVNAALHAEKSGFEQDNAPVAVSDRKAQENHHQVGFWVAHVPDLIHTVREGEHQVREGKDQKEGEGRGELYSRYMREHGSLQLSRAGFEERFDGFGVLMDLDKKQVRCISDDWKADDHAHMAGAHRNHLTETQWVHLPEIVSQGNSHWTVSLEQTSKGWVRAALVVHNSQVDDPHHSGNQQPVSRTEICDVHLPHVQLELSLGVTSYTGKNPTQTLSIAKVLTTTYDFGHVSHLVEDTDLRAKLKEIEEKPVKGGYVAAIDRLSSVVALYNEKFGATATQKLHEEIYSVDHKLTGLEGLVEEKLLKRRHRTGIKHLAMGFEREMKRDLRQFDHLHRRVKSEKRRHQGNFDRWLEALHLQRDEHGARFSTERMQHVLGLLLLVVVVVLVFFAVARRLSGGLGGSSGVVPQVEMINSAAPNYSSSGTVNTPYMQHQQGPVANGINGPQNNMLNQGYDNGYGQATSSSRSRFQTPTIETSFQPATPQTTGMRYGGSTASTASPYGLTNSPNGVAGSNRPSPTGSAYSNPMTPPAVHATASSSGMYSSGATSGNSIYHSPRRELYENSGDRNLMQYLNSPPEQDNTATLAGDSSSAQRPSPTSMIGDFFRSRQKPGDDKENQLPSAF